MSGIGKRFIDSGYSTPKPLIIVDGKPIIQHVINLFPNETNVKFICNNVHLEKTNMRNILCNICPSGEIYEVPLENRKGPVHAVSMIFDDIDDHEEVIVSYCDYSSYWGYENFLKDIKEKNAHGAIACYRGFHPHMLNGDNYAFVREKKHGSKVVDAIQEKQPFTNNKMSEYASNGTYYFKTGAIMKHYFQKLMDLNLQINNEYYVSMVYNLMIEDGLNVNIFEIEHMLQWGTPDDLENYRSWSKYFNNIMQKQTIYNDKNNTTTVLPLAGRGSRFSQQGYALPKPLIEVNDKPMVVEAIRCLPQSKNNVFICMDKHLNEYSLGKKIKQYYPDSKIFGIDGVTEGQACTAEHGITESNMNLDNPILITACDNGVYYDVEKYESLVNDTTNDVIVWSFRNEPTSKNNPNMYAWMETDENDFVKRVSCKQFNEEIHDVKNSHVIIGTIFFRKAKYFIEGLQKNYQANIKTNDEFYVDDVINQNIKSGLKIKVFEVENYICWGTPDDYETFLYWQNFFHKCSWHPYIKTK